MKILCVGLVVAMNMLLATVKAQGHDADLEKQYQPIAWSIKGENALREYERILNESSIKAVQTVPSRLGIAYGDTDAQKLDLFGEISLPKSAPIFVFVHGGFWIKGSRQSFRNFVPPFHKAGIISCVVGYDLISNSVKIPDMVLQIQKAIGFVLDYAKERGSSGVYICGHSAGGHLVPMALSILSEKLKNTTLLKGVILISGMYNLIPLLQTSHSDTAKITQEIAWNYSPQFAIGGIKNRLHPSASVYAIVTEHDSPAFKDQSLTYSKALRDAGIKSICEIVKGEDHFTVIEKLPDPEFTVTKKLIDYIRSP